MLAYAYAKEYDMICFVTFVEESIVSNTYYIFVCASEMYLL